MTRSLIFSLCLCSALPGKPIPWEEKVEDGQAVLDYLKMKDTVAKPEVEITARLAIPRTPQPGPRDTVVPVPPHIPTWNQTRFAIRKKVENAQAGRTSGKEASRFDVFALADLIRYRWVSVKQHGPDAWIAGRGTWANKIASSRDLPKLTSRTIKGLGGMDRPHHLEDLVALGIGHATVNIHLNSILHTEDADGRGLFTFENSRYYIDPRARDQLDKTIGFLSKNKIVVSAILLVTPPRGAKRHPMIHPETDPAGTLAMPNLATPAGAKCYAAALTYLAERYSRPDSDLGRISNWIAHNEIDQAWTWTNMGEQPMPRLLETYYRSMRLIHCIARKYDRHARVFASFTHHWNHPGDGRRTYCTREMLSLLNQLSKAEGDFDWGVAFHPYPQSLLKQRTWEDTQPTYSFDTPKITMKNIEVLAAFLRQPQFLYQGKERPLLLSEQGFHTPNYTEAHQRDQAAALVYTWHKLKALPNIEAFHYHRWFDNPQEGGLKLGLRTLASPAHPIGEKKLAWSIYQALGTDQEAKRTEFARNVLGLEKFSKIPYRGPIAGAR